MIDGDDYTWERVAPYLHSNQVRDLRTVDQRMADELGDLRAKNFQLVCEVKRLNARVAALEAAACPPQPL